MDEAASRQEVRNLFDDRKTHLWRTMRGVLFGRVGLSRALGARDVLKSRRARAIKQAASMKGGEGELRRLCAEGLELLRVVPPLVRERAGSRGPVRANRAPIRRHGQKGGRYRIYQ